MIDDFPFSLLWPLLWLSLTLCLFFTAYKLYQKTRFLLLNPVVVSIVSLAGGLWWLDIPYSAYMQGGQWIDWFLEPSVVALGYPLYQQRKEIQRDGFKLLTCTLVASLLAITSMLLLAALLSLSKETAISGSAKAITTAIAMVVSEQQGGIPALTAITVIFAGMFGSLLAIPFMNMTHITSAKAQGLAMGAASHALGTARIREEGTTQGAYSALSLVLCAIFTAVLTPLLLPFLLPLLGY